MIRAGNGSAQLFINNQDGTFTNKANPYGVAGGHQGSACSVADFDGDRWLDIFVASHAATFTPSAGSTSASTIKAA